MGHLKQYFAGLVAAFGAFCLGTSLGWSGPVGNSVLSGEAFKFAPSLDEWSWAASLFTLGAACVCIPVGILTFRFGRKLIMLLLMLPCLLGWVCIIGAQRPFMLLIGRFILGASIGSFCLTVPIYTTEIAEVETRGVMGCFFQLMFALGILFSFVVGSLCKVFLLNILCGVFPAIFFLTFMWMPESPVFLAQKGKTEQAEKALKWLRGKDSDIGADLAAMEADSKKEKTNIFKSLSRKVTIKGLCITITLLLFQQFSGINGICFYVATIFEEAGTGMSPAISTILIGVVGVVALIPAILFVDMAGRRIFLIVSGILMFLTTFIMGAYFKWLMEKKVGWLPMAAICIFVFGLSMGFGPVPWLIMAEMFAEDVKPICGAIVATCSWLFAFCVTKVFPLCLQDLGPSTTFWGFCVISFLAIIFVIFVVPETKGKSLDEIQQLLKG
ncbi:facilitated trehalose transporter Tret1-2 homolog [Drosophila novamexicana]|uniref:facilitated trehalose transporter Tret1-2 homolog n=1 Tax=Drosophila novamexicana TaxID=47314 RepID=UPI0011E5D8BD|nr:facilitated trehalose transporter Tret1-2 homolog [Drosophila novamexicana]XP_030554117.1 facilitated trehalose transporter Tret1-2 homolog [Drosophila novamexicana]